MTDSNRAGWILVGGRSARMGSDKALLRIGGRPLALRIADAVAEVCGPVTLVGDPARYASLGLPVLADEFAGEGPLSGIEAALRGTRADWN
ncbi:MAG: NTP transferase domain-containing protein, partial [Acidobacteriota bacterium]